MKKQLIILSLILLLGACGVEQITTTSEIGSISFDDKTMTFYLDVTEFERGELLMYTQSVYFKDGENDLRHDGSTPIYKNKDRSKLFFVDFWGNENLYTEDDKLIEPTELIFYEVKGTERHLKVYILDNDQAYFTQVEGTDPETILKCTSSATNRSYSCSGKVNISYEDIMAILNRGELIEDISQYTDYKLKETFLSIDFNRHPIEASSRNITLSKEKLDDGRTIICHTESSNTYYLLSEDLMLELENLIKID